MHACSRLHGFGADMATEHESGPELNGTLLSLVLIFIPGILCYGIIAALAEKRERDNVTLFLQVFTYGVFSYLALALAHWLVPSVFPGVDGIAILKPSDISTATIDPKVIGWASLFGAILGLFVTLNLNRQYLLKLCRRIGITERFGDVDVWTLLLNSTDTDNYVTIRHKERGLVYQGYVSGFSSGGETRELLIINVRVYAEAPAPVPDTEAGSGEAEQAGNSSLQQVGEIPFLYMSFKDDDVILEFGQKPDI
jgi:hypothetical protein